MRQDRKASRRETLKRGREKKKRDKQSEKKKNEGNSDERSKKRERERKNVMGSNVQEGCPEQLVGYPPFSEGSKKTDGNSSSS